MFLSYTDLRLSIGITTPLFPGSGIDRTGSFRVDPYWRFQDAHKDLVYSTILLACLCLPEKGFCEKEILARPGVWDSLRFLFSRQPLGKPYLSVLSYNAQFHSGVSKA